MSQGRPLSRRRGALAVSDLHLRVLRQVARARRRGLQSAGAEPTTAGGEDRLREATDARSRADAQLAAASARRRLAADADASEEQR